MNHYLLYLSIQRVILSDILNNISVFVSLCKNLLYKGSDHMCLAWRTEFWSLFLLIHHLKLFHAGYLEPSSYLIKWFWKKPGLTKKKLTVEEWSKMITYIFLCKLWWVMDANSRKISLLSDSVKSHFPVNNGPIRL